MHKLTIDWIKEKGLLILEVIAGSKAYGLDTPASDTDIRGVFVLPREMFYGLEYTPQVNNEKNDIVYYELNRFVELLARNNPNILEMLNMPPACVLQRHPVMDLLQPGLFFSKLCQQTFANYANTQIKKAYGLEKKIVNPVDAIRKSVIDFCFVYQSGQSVSLASFLEERQWVQEKAGLTAIDHFRDCYNLFYIHTNSYGGILKKEAANEVSLSSIPKGEVPVAILYFNRDGYSTYCKRYKEYWDWVNKRNEERYKSTLAHGKNYDAKNMMHVFRLLKMAKELAVEGKINVFREDRDFLLGIKQGQFEYDDLVQKAEELNGELDLLYNKSQLPEAPDRGKINELLVKMREICYTNTSSKVE